jgi:N4-gp56 family major capsid protein
MATITSSTSTLPYDREKYLVNKLLEIAEQRLVMKSICDKDSMRKGAGLTAYMVRYKPMRLPLSALSEGETPAEGSIELEEVTVTLEQWGHFLRFSDVVELTTKHPLFQQANEMLADNAARTMDREIQLVMLAGTNVYYGDGSVSARSSVTSAMTLKSALLFKVRAALVRAGAPNPGKKSHGAKNANASGTVNGDGLYTLIAGPEVINDLQLESSGAFLPYAQYSNAKALEHGEVGQWAGFRFVETNFIPVYKLIGDAAAAVSSESNFGAGVTPVVTAVGSGGSLPNATMYYKITRKSLLDGFEDEISTRHSTATGASSASMTFNFSSLTAGHVYNLYFGDTDFDSDLFRVSENIAVGTTVTVTAVPTSGVSAPSSLATSTAPNAVHVVYIVAGQALGWSGFYDTKFIRSAPGATDADPLAQRKTIGYKFFGKSVIKDQTRLVRLEVASANG